MLCYIISCYIILYYIICFTISHDSMLYYIRLHGNSIFLSRPLHVTILLLHGFTGAIVCRSLGPGDFRVAAVSAAGFRLPSSFRL